MRIEELIGANIRRERERHGMTQDRLAELLVERLGKSWNRQQVSLAERGGRALAAVELLAFTDALGVPIVSLLVPPPGLLDVEIPGSRYRVDVHQALLGISAAEGDAPVEALGAALVALAEAAPLLDRIAELLGGAHQGLAKVARDTIKGAT